MYASAIGADTSERRGFRQVAELVDALGLGSSTDRFEGSSPSLPTNTFDPGKHQHGKHEHTNQDGCPSYS